MSGHNRARRKKRRRMGIGSPLKNRRVSETKMERLFKNLEASWRTYKHGRQ